MDYADAVLKPIVAFVLAFLGWIIKKLREDHDSLRADFSRHKEDLSKEYVPSKDFDKFEKRIFEKLDGIEIYLRGKSDRN